MDNVQETEDNHLVIPVTPEKGLENVKEGEEQYCPLVEEKLVPYVGQIFADVDQAIRFYEAYALECGFDVRKSTTKRFRGGSFKSKLLLCNREGFAQISPTSSKSQPSETIENAEKDDGNDSKRTTKIRRTGCKARMRVSMNLTKGVLVVVRFDDGHNHELYTKDDMEFQKLSRNVSTYHKELILNNSRLRIGATKTYNMCKENVNGFENIGANLIDFKNFQRDVKCFIGDRDGQLFIDHFKNMAETREGFFFDYEVDDKGRLCRAIWADDIARRNYSVYGDALSYDPTYGTNKYFMLFTPFTGVDNHKRSVTFAGALLAHEDYESFNWVFSRFLVAMGGKEPEYIITDQDPAIIKSVEEIFKTARHRFCMWHILNKVPTKFGSGRADYNDFLKKLNDIVWDDEIEPSDFDMKWKSIMVEHDVGTEDWFEEIFDIRSQWVLAHCKDLNMGRIMKTTQRSESSNSFFKRFEDKCGTLVEFWMRFESAMDKQRHNQKQLDNENRHAAPKLITLLPLESDGAKIYTHAAFGDFQEEVKQSLTTCSVSGFYREDGTENTTIDDAGNGRSYNVIYNGGTSAASCTCRLFETKGIICRHIIWILSGKRHQTIPEDVLANRWTKNAIMNKFGNYNGKLTSEGGSDGMLKKHKLSKLWCEVYSTIGVIGNKDESDIECLCTLLKEFRLKLEPIEVPLSKDSELERLLGCASSKEVSILPPKQSKNKGSGKRMLSSKAKAVAVSRKAKRLCGFCKKMSHHDSRNCPLNPKSKTYNKGVKSKLSEDDSEYENDDGEEDEMEVEDYCST